VWFRYIVCDCHYKSELTSRIAGDYVPTPPPPWSSWHPVTTSPRVLDTTLKHKAGSRLRMLISLLLSSLLCSRKQWHTFSLYINLFPTSTSAGHRFILTRTLSRLSQSFQQKALLFGMRTLMLQTIPSLISGLHLSSMPLSCILRLLTTSSFRGGHSVRRYVTVPRPARLSPPRTTNLRLHRSLPSVPGSCVVYRIRMTTTSNS